ncbi:ABC transporter permease subunit [Homoserinibacter sp. YIM 151385]|uniref:ABC transporter permease subunit n=1 Tax=Homoserinibacter sp. YIM 151385 TaxID=2985506 RepID=UPI0022F137E9|nr:ABC transporter permease subunit [Homoserinibacter sp. YIM 151385]WBU37506.1 ABC transporter permease subunit [Homoserinibacter sp. YIM 151385]
MALTTSTAPAVTGGRRGLGVGFLVKLVVVGLADALGLYGVLTSLATEQWGILVFLVAILAVVNWAYFSRRAVAAKYLVPGVIFLFAYQIFAIGYTGYVAFTNYGDGHNSTKSDAIEQISMQNEVRVEGSASYPLTVVAQGERLGFAVVVDGEAQLGAPDQPLAPAPDATVAGEQVEAVPGWETLRFVDIASRQAEVTALRVALSDDPADGSLRTQDASTAFVAVPALQYDAEADAFVDTADGTVYTPSERGNFVSEDGEALSPGWRVGVGFDNFGAMVADARMAGPFVQIFLWTFAFAFLSVVTTFALGIFLAVTFNDQRLRGRRIYRSLFILPYAFPGFLSALVWAGMLNDRFGYINVVLFGGADIPWLTDPVLAKASVILVNLWLGFPYMFLICTGALQAVPADLVDAARIDGAGRWQIFRNVTLPFVMVTVTPLLISSFAFNFNNFALIYMLTGGGPNFVGTPYVVGHTDVLISMVYSVAFESGSKQYGVASALSLLIFVMVGVISWLGFRRARRLEEI